MALVASFISGTYAADAQPTTAQEESKDVQVKAPETTTTVAKPVDVVAPVASTTAPTTAVSTTTAPAATSTSQPATTTQTAAPAAPTQSETSAKVSADRDERVKKAEDLAAKLMQQLSSTIKAAKEAQAAQKATVVTAQPVATETK